MFHQLGGIARNWKRLGLLNRWHLSLWVRIPLPSQYDSVAQLEEQVSPKDQVVSSNLTGATKNFLCKKS